MYDHTLDYLLNHPDSMEMHEVYCFLRLAEQMPEHDFAQVKPKLTRLVLNAVNTNPESWKQYAAQPLNFVNRPQSFLFPLLQEHISVNLDFRVDNLAEHGIAIPPWDWTGYAQAWQAARIEISGRLTVADLAILKRFGRLDT